MNKKQKCIAALAVGILCSVGFMLYGGVEGVVASQGVVMAVGAGVVVGEEASPEIKELNDGLATVQGLFSEFKKTQDARLQKLEKGEHVPAELEAKLTKLEEALTDADAKYQKLVDDKATLEAKVNQMNTLVENAQEAKTDEHREAFRFFCRKGDDNVIARNAKGEPIVIDGNQVYMKQYLEQLQKKTMSAGSDPDGGYMIPQAIATRMIEIMTETSPIRAEAMVENITIDEYTYLVDDDTVGAGWVGEHDTRPKTDTSKLAKGRIVAHEIYANPFATQKMLDDAAFNVEQWLNRKVTEKFNLVEATAFVSGNGVAKPRGFLTYANGSSVNQIEQVNQGHATLIDDADGLINLQNALESWWAGNAKWFMRRSTVGAVRLLKETTGQYIWQPGLQAGESAVLLGDPIVKCADMPAIGANALAVAYGNMREAYTIVDRQGVRVLRDPYSNKPYVEFYTTKRVGGAVVNGKALKLLKIAE